MRPPMCLQYIIMAMAAEATDAHANLAMPFYRRSRTYAEADEMKVRPQRSSTPIFFPPLTLCAGPRGRLYNPCTCPDVVPLSPL